MFDLDKIFYANLENQLRQWCSVAIATSSYNIMHVIIVLIILDMAIEWLQAL